MLTSGMCNILPGISMLIFSLIIFTDTVDALVFSQLPPMTSLSAVNGADLKRGACLVKLELFRI